ncbi:MAG TPA: hypothetical protein VFB25_11690 [Gaiellaceae bacterium]|nr:hypothetical protein [Gaiellaceae bacterium]
MHLLSPAMYEELARQREHDLQRDLRRADLRREARLAGKQPPLREPVLLRLARDEDDEALACLAKLDGAPAPTGRHVVAEVGGKVVAALPLGGGRMLADPFRRTAHLEPLLELRARQLTGEPHRRWSLGALVPAWPWSRAA